MAPSSPLDYWRGFFRGAGASIFDAIDAAILVAAADHPAGLRARRDGIAERLYTALLVLPPPAPPTPSPVGPAAALARRRVLSEDAGASVPSLCSSDRVEAITEDTAPNADVAAAEVLRIKKALSNCEEKSEAEVLELLRRLQQLEFTVDTIRDTEIGMAVKGLRKHGSKHIRQFVRTLIEGWKAIVNEWMSNGGSIVDHPEFMDPSGLEEEEGGLPSPPMDEAAFFATRTSIRLSKFFDEMDDDGNIKNSSKEGGQRCLVDQEQVRNQPSQQQPMVQCYDPEQNWSLDHPVMRQPRPQEQPNGGAQMRQQFIKGAQGKLSSMEPGPGRPQRPPLEPKGSETRLKQQQVVPAAQRRPHLSPPNKPASQLDDNSVRAKLELAKNAKLEATKRKLQEGYQEFDNAKRQRTIQMVDPQDIPKQANRNWQPNAKPRNNNSTIRNRPSMRH